MILETEGLYNVERLYNLTRQSTFTCWLVRGTSILYQEHKHEERIRGKSKPYPYGIIYPIVENISAGGVATL